MIRLYILCEGQTEERFVNKLTAEYALRDINKPIGVSGYKLSDFVPEQFADTLPTAEDIECRIKVKYDTEPSEVKDE